MANRTYEPLENVSLAMVDTVARIGYTLRLAGLIFQGMGETSFFYFPDHHHADGRWYIPSMGEWAAILKQSDDPVIFAADETGQLKPWIRKSQAAISSQVQQKIWAQDEFRCMYCGRPMGVDNVILTIDHFMPLELGGVNNESNYLSACRRCNKDKGNMHPVEWCAQIGEKVERYVHYLKSRRI